jgi:hypothetical protein
LPQFLKLWSVDGEIEKEELFAARGQTNAEATCMEIVAEYIYGQAKGAMPEPNVPTPIFLASANMVEPGTDRR